MTVLKAEQLFLSYGDVSILKSIDLYAKKGQFVGIIGPNGSGKSTFLKCLYRSLEADSGQIYLKQQNLKTISYRETAKQLAVVSQQHDYQFDFTVEEMVLMGRFPYKKLFDRETEQDIQLLSTVLKWVGMSDFRERQFNTLSGGEQQRILLARALIQEPECLILDEPTNHLDIQHQIQLLKMVKELPITVISAIHDLNLASLYCDVIYVLFEGEVVAVGKPSDVLTPKLIKQIYQVDVEIVLDSFGNQHILFL